MGSPGTPRGGRPFRGAPGRPFRRAPGRPLRRAPAPSVPPAPPGARGGNLRGRPAAAPPGRTLHGKPTSNSPPPPPVRTLPETKLHAKLSSSYLTGKRLEPAEGENGRHRPNRVVKQGETKAARVGMEDGARTARTLRGPGRPAPRSPVEPVAATASGVPQPAPPRRQRGSGRFAGSAALPQALSSTRGAPSTARARPFPRRGSGNPLATDGTRLTLCLRLHGAGLRGDSAARQQTRGSGGADRRRQAQAAAAAPFPRAAPRQAGGERRRHLPARRGQRRSPGAALASAAGPALVRGGGDPAGTTTAKRSPARGQRAARPAPLSASGRRASRGRPEHPPRSGCGPRGVSALPLPAGWLAARSPGPYSVKI